MAKSKEPEHKLIIRNARLTDYDDLKEIMDQVYVNILNGVWTKKELKSLLKEFSEGQICIEDNGKGFDVNKESQGNGLKNMKKRAQEIGANLLIESESGTGTTLQLILNIA